MKTYKKLLRLRLKAGRGEDDTPVFQFDHAD